MREFSPDVGSKCIAMVPTDRLNDAGVALVAQCHAYSPSSRITAKEALDHPYFDGLNRETVGTIPLPF